MTMHGDHVTEVEDAAFDSTMKVVGVIVGLIVIVGGAFWYLYS